MIQKQHLPTLDVIIPCYNAADTIERALASTLMQPCAHIWLVNDGSTDDTLQVLAKYIATLSADAADKITVLTLPVNSGVAMARNFGALHSTADLLAFLDADDAYQADALAQVPQIFSLLAPLGTLRLPLIPVNLAARYATHPQLAAAWDNLQMTVGGNIVIRRALFLAAGGFPTDALFGKFGGEDGALGIALARTTLVGTLFDQSGVLHHCREGMHAYRLLDAQLFGITDTRIGSDEMAAAEQVSLRIQDRLQSLMPILQHTDIGRRPLHLAYE